MNDDEDEKNATKKEFNENKEIMDLQTLNNAVVDVDDDA